MKSRRILMSILGVLVGAVSVGFFKLAAFGVDPFQSFMSGIDRLIPVSFGTLYVIVNACLLLFALIFDRHYIGVATFVNLFLLGYVVEFSYATLQFLFPDPSMVVRGISFVIGFVVLCFASDIYVIDPRGVDSLIESMPDGRFIIAYIHANDSLRERAFLSRDASATHETFVARECAESPEFDEFERRLSTSDLPPCVCCAIFFTNGYTAMNAESIAKTLAVVTGRSSFVDNDI